MYGWLWRHLPGHWSLRVGELLVLVVGAVALLMYVVFPAVDPHLPFNDVTVNGPAPSQPPTSTATTPGPSPTATATLPGD